METVALRDAVRAKLVNAAQRDPRVVGLIDYGSSSEGRADAWSDLDVALFLRDADASGFEEDWPTWIAQFGTLQLAFLHAPHRPWAVYDATPVPLRVDFHFVPVSRLEELQGWPNSPTSAAAMVLYDATDGELTRIAERLVGQSLAPLDLPSTFARACGGFWYYLLRAHGKLQRDSEWAARFEYNFLVTGLLHALLRLEAGAVGRWRAAESAVGLEAAISGERLIALNRCIPGPGRGDLHRAMANTGALGREVCAAIALTRGWAWPTALADRLQAILAIADD